MVLNGFAALAIFTEKSGVSVFLDVSKPLLNYITNHPNCATMKQDFHAMGHKGIMNLFNAIYKKTHEKEILLDVKVNDQSIAVEELTKL